MRKLEIKGGVVEGQVMTAEQIKRLADVPSRAQLLSSALGSRMSPLVGLVGVLTGLQRNLVYALDQIRQEGERAAECRDRREEGSPIRNSQSEKRLMRGLAVAESKTRSAVKMAKDDSVT